MIITTTPDLGAGEFVLLENPDVEVKSTGFNLVLTNRRLILDSKRANDTAKTEIPVPVILSAAQVSSDSYEPAISLSIKAPDGSDRKMLIIFSGNTGIAARDHCYNEICGIIPKNKQNRPESNNMRKNFSGNSYSPYESRLSRFPPETAGNENRPPPPPRPYRNQRGGIDKNFPHEGFSPQEYNPKKYDYSHSDHSEERTTEYFRRTHSSGVPPTNIKRTPPPSPPGYRDINNPGIKTGSSYSSDYPSGYYGQSNSNAFSYNENSRTDYNQRSSEQRTVRQAQKNTGFRFNKRRKTAGFGSFKGGFSGGNVDTDSLTGTFTAFLTSPFEAYRSTRRKDLSEVIPVLMISLIVFALGNTIILGILASGLDPAVYPVLLTLTDAGTIIFVSVEIVIAGILITAFNGILTHLVTYYYGYDDDIENTIKIYAYSSIPYATGGIIPIFGIIIAPFWSIYLQIKGIQERFSMDVSQAAVIVLIPSAFFVILFAMFALTGGDGFSIFG